MNSKSEITKKEINEVIADSAIRNRNLYIFFGGVCLFFLLAGLSTPEEAFLDLSNNGIEIPFAGIELPYIFFYTAAPLLLLIVQGHLYLNLAKHRQRRKDNSYPELMAPFTFDFADIASEKSKVPKHNDILSLLFRIFNYCVLSVLPTLTFLCLLFRITDYQDMGLIVWNTITLVVSAIFVVSFIPGWSKLPRNICNIGCILLYSVVVMGIYIIIYNNYSQIVNSDDAEHCGEKHILYDIPGAKVFTPGKISLPFYHKDSKEYSYTNYAGRSFVCADFTEADFKNQNFVITNFNKAQLNRIQLQGAKLWDANLRLANMTGGNLSDANFEAANLRGADLRDAQMQGVELENANLQGANLQGANLQSANFKNAKLQGADLRDAQMQGVELENANLQGADLRDAQMQGFELENANLQSANLQGANLQSANIQGANLKYAQLQGANLLRAQLQGANLQDADLQGADLFRVQLQGAYLWEAQLQGADLKFAQLQGASCKVELYAENGLLRIRDAVNKNTKLTVEDCINGTLSQDDIEKIMEEIPPSTQDIEISYFPIEKTTIGNKIRKQLEKRKNKIADFRYAECGELTEPMADFLEKSWEQGISFNDWSEEFLSDSLPLYRKTPCDRLTKQAK